ncbi:hypothetical protein N9W34_05250 [Rickettsiales bacterium]|nr:hypothetical protein [Rickettsiales bacterium]
MPKVRRKKRTANNKYISIVMGLGRILVRPYILLTLSFIIFCSWFFMAGYYQRTVIYVDNLVTTASQKNRAGSQGCIS